MKSIIIKSLFILPTAIILSACSGEEVNNEEPEVVLDPLVTLYEAQYTSFKHEIRVQGNVETDQDIMLTAEMGGLITSIKVKEGQKVSKGQVIAQVDASILSSNMQELKTQLEYAEYMLDKQIELNKRGVGSEFDLETAQSQVNSLKATMQSLSTQQGKATIRAPFSGVIDQVFAKQGQMAGPAAPIVRLVNNKTVDIVASISEKHFDKVKEGTSMTVYFPNYSDTSIQLKITNVGNYIEPTNRTFRVKSTITNNNYFLPNMLAEVSIVDLAVDSGLVVPSSSVLKDQENLDFVYTAVPYKSEDGKELFKVKKVLVSVIERFEGSTLLNEGSIKQNEKVVVKGARGVANGDIVRNK